MMTTAVSVSDQGKWANVLRQQKLANAQRWLLRVEREDNPSQLVLNDYDNLLRALEASLEYHDTFDIAYRLIQSLHSSVFGFADWDRWLAYVEQALFTSRQLQRESEEGQLMTVAATILVHQGNLIQAKSYFRQSVIKFKKLGDRINYSRSLGRLANVYALQGNLVTSQILCQKALKVALATKDRLTIGMAYLDLSFTHIKSRAWPEGLNSARAAQAIFSELNHHKPNALAMLNIVSIQGQLGNWEESGQMADDLMTVLDAEADVQTMIQLKNNLGVAAYHQADYLKAEQSWQEALQLNSKVQNPMEMANLYNNLGMVYTRLEEWNMAEMMLRQSARTFEAMGDVFFRVNALDNLADLYAVQGKTVVSQSVLLEAIAILQAADLYSHSPHYLELLNTMQQRLAHL